VQMWQRCAQSRCRCGSGAPGPGADVAAAMHKNLRRFEVGLVSAQHPRHGANGACQFCRRVASHRWCAVACCRTRVQLHAAQKQPIRRHTRAERRSASQADSLAKRRQRLESEARGPCRAGYYAGWATWATVTGGVPGILPCWVDTLPGELPCSVGSLPGGQPRANMPGGIRRGAFGMAARGKVCRPVQHFPLELSTVYRTMPSSVVRVPLLQGTEGAGGDPVHLAVFGLSASFGSMAGMHGRCEVGGDTSRRARCRATRSPIAL
jgi:hypothetical protein